VKRPAHRYNGTLVNSLKKPDAVAAVAALVESLTPEQTTVYLAATELPAKPKLPELRDEIVLLMDIAKGTYAPPPTPDFLDAPAPAPDLDGLAAREAQTKEPDIINEIKRQVANEEPQQEATTMLLIGCIPVGMPAPMLMDLLEPLVDEFYKAQGVLPGCWKDYSVTGWDQIANGLYGAVEGGTLDLPAVLLVDRADPKPVVDVLVRYYDVIVRGV
jgi:hypothetical protein